MINILNLALPYFGLIFIGFACGRSKGLPEAGLAWMNFFLLYVSLPALLLESCRKRRSRNSTTRHF
jgi:predicted permease